MEVKVTQLTFGICKVCNKNESKYSRGVCEECHNKKCKIIRKLEEEGLEAGTEEYIERLKEENVYY